MHEKQKTEIKSKKNAGEVLSRRSLFINNLCFGRFLLLPVVFAEMLKEAHFTEGLSCFAYISSMKDKPVVSF